MASTIILSDNGVSSGTSGIKYNGGNDGTLQLQTTTAGGTATTALTINNSQVVTFANQPTYSGGTVNGVAYLNGSKVLTTGSVLVFDGTNLGVGAASPAKRLQLGDNTVTSEMVRFANTTANFDVGMTTSGCELTTANNQPIIFKNNAAERMRIDTAGNVGIGTASPGAKLDVAGSMAGASVTFSNFGSATTAVVGLGDGNTGLFRPAAQTLGFTANGAERARIDTSGYFMVGGVSTNANRGLVNVLAPAGTSCGFSFAEGVSAQRGRLYWSGSGVNLINDDNSTMNFGTTGTTRVSINATGTVTFNAYGAGTLTTNASGVISASDGRFKYKTRPIENAISLVTQLSPTYYRWNEDCDFHTEHEELGFFAQEVGAVIPEASPEPERAHDYMEDGVTIKTRYYKNYSDRAVIAVLVKAIQEQQALITTLTERITALEAK
jgi:hypothetical protein